MERHRWLLIFGNILGKRLDKQQSVVYGGVYGRTDGSDDKGEEMTGSRRDHGRMTESQYRAQRQLAALRPAKQQGQLLKMINLWRRTMGESPTKEEMRAYFGWTWETHAQIQCEYLVKKGFLMVAERAKHRNLRITDKGRSWLVSEGEIVESEFDKRRRQALLRSDPGLKAEIEAEVRREFGRIMRAEGKKEQE